MPIEDRMSRCGLLLLSLIAMSAQRSPAVIRVTETVIGAVDGFKTAIAMGISPDQRQFHYVVKRDRKEILVTSRGQSRPYDRISEGVYNPQSTRYAFVGTDGGHAMAIVDGAASRPYDQIDPRDLRFSPDGRHFAFRATRAAQQFIELDGREIGPFQDVLGLTFAPDQQLLYGYMTRQNGRWIVTCGQHQSAAYERVSGARGITFSPDGKTWTYHATLAGQSLNIVEGSLSASYPGAEPRRPPTFSTDGNRLLFPALSTDGQSIDARIVSLRDPEAQTTIEGDEVFFSQDLQRLAAAKRTATGEYAVTVNAVTYHVKSVNPPAVHFSATGARYMIHANGFSRDAETANLIIDGEPAPVDHRVSSVAFSPDGSSWAYTATIREELMFRHVVVRDGRQIHVSSTSGEPRLTFGPDSRRLAYTVAHGYASWALAIDGEEAPNTYDFLPFEARLVFDSPSELHTIAVRNGQVLLVTLQSER
jgi:WD40 repeat protein